ncbi:hypothetical protein DPMN_134140 [Dreissena polymorpha]|uniref:Uncharacterized protein n=1 Tax=Dreissena polymorpha TaxID=45954 RepID=A0A9D4FWV4_DREPO|nr:hypothetical protein DPMN_134140 [Dreissena polymorpha]
MDTCSAKRKTTEGLRSGKRSKPTGNTDSTRNKLDTFLLDVMTLFKRNDVSKSEWPKMQQPNPTTTLFKLRLKEYPKFELAIFAGDAGFSLTPKKVVTTVLRRETFG